MDLGICPVRISFAGGGTDMPEYYEVFGGNVVATTITRFTYVMVNFRNDNSFQVFSSDFARHDKPTRFENLKLQKGTELVVSSIKYLKFKRGANFVISSDVPPRSGLGSSSSLAVNLVNTISTLKGEKFSKSELAEKAFDIARNYLKWPIGKQDEFIAAHGGLNFIEFKKNETRVKKIPISKKKLEELENNLLLFFLGGHTSMKILSSQIKKTKNLDNDTIDSLHKVKELGKELYKQLRKSNINSFGDFLTEGWKAKKKFTKGVTDDHIDKIYNMAIKNGAIGGKLTGAGGGGHLLLYCEKSKQNSLISTMKNIGLKQVEFSFYNEGAKVLSLYDAIK